MAASTFPSRLIGWLAIAIGAVTVLGIVSLMLFFTIGGVFRLLTATCMAVGFLAGSGICGGLDDMDAAPWVVNLGLLGSLGCMFLYPCWCLRLGGLLVSNSATMHLAIQL